MSHIKKDWEMLEEIRAIAEDKFDANFVMGRKNVILLRRHNPMRKIEPFMTIKVNFHDKSFHHGDYDMGFDAAVENFKLRVAESNFNPEFDVPAV